MTLALALAAAHAHVGEMISGIDALPDAAGADLEASWGLVVRDGAGFAWICHEAMTEPGALRSPRYARADDGTWFGWLPDPLQGRGGATLFRSADGCDWDPPAGLDGVVVTGAAPGEAGEVRAAGDGPGGGGIWRSTDGGLSFAPEVGPLPDRRFASLVAGPGGAWATATDPAGERVFAWFRPTGGDWAERELTLPGGLPTPVHPWLLAAGPEGTAWVALDPTGPDSVLRLDAGGATATPLGLPAGAVVDGAAQGDALLVVIDGLTLWRVDASGAASTIDDFPLGLGVAVHGDTVWAAPQSFVVGSLLEASAAGGPFETAAWPDDVLAPLSCPADSDVARACEPLWEGLLPRIRGYDGPPLDSADPGSDPDPAGTPDDPADAGAGCGCATGGGLAGASVWALALVGLARRRR